METLTANGAPTSFDVAVTLDGDRNGDGTVDLYYCNDTDAVGCNPLSRAPQRMTRGAGMFVASMVVGPPDDPNDTLSLAAIGTDPDGVVGLPLYGEVTLASSACAHGTSTFKFSGAPASFVVPSGCTSIVAKVWGAGGGGGGGDTGDTGTSGGGGGFARSTLTVTPTGVASLFQVT